jgi:hypothetical protein
MDVDKRVSLETAYLGGEGDADDRRRSRAVSSECAEDAPGSAHPAVS